jgi:hypothetical protein
MFAKRCLFVCALMAIATSAFAEQWEEVFPEKNSARSKFHFDRNVKAIGKNSVQVRYKILESQTHESISGGPKRPFNITVYRANIDCSTRAWKFINRTYYLNDAIQFNQKMDAGSGNMPPPPKGGAPFLIGEKACALR